MKTIYILDYKLKWKIFKKLQETVKRDITIVGFDKMLWQLMKKKKIYCYFVDDMDMGIGLEISKKYKNYKVKIIKNAKKR